MKCKKCGAEVPAGMKFCGECGTAIPQIIKCACCGADIEAGMKFCGNCGAPVSQKKKCISCGAEISYNLKFCPECGANQSQASNNGTPAKPSVTPSKPEEPITMVENLELKKAREQFFACDGNLSEILKTAESLWKAHSTNEDILSLYLAALAAGGKEIEAFKVIEGLGEGILSTYISAIDILLTKEELEGVRLIRRVLSGGNPADITEQFISMLDKTRTNDEFLHKLKDWVRIYEREGFVNGAQNRYGKSL